MILVTGAARSGTSLTTQIFQKCGAFLGEPVNGLFENTHIRDRLMKPYLRSINADPLGQWPLPDMDRLDRFPGLRNKVLGQFKGHNSRPLCYKGAKMCLVWPVWKEAFPEAKWVIVRRDDEGIIDSCLRTSFMRAFDDVEGWQKWLDVHKERFAEMMAEIPNVIEIWPDRYIGDPDTLMEPMANLGLAYDRDTVKSCIDPTRFK